MSPSLDHLGKAKIHRLLAAVGSVPARERAAGDVTPYDWRDPHSLNTDQLNRLAAIMSQVAAKLGDVFTRFFSREFDVSPTAVSQHFAGDLQRGIDPDGSYCLTFGPDKGPSCGFLAISSPTTMAWVSRLLGDTEPGGDPDRPLSSLEESLLSDLVAVVLDVFLNSLRPHENLRSVGRLSKGQPEIQFELTEAICRITFRVQETDKGGPSDITFLLPCDRLAALAGKTPAAAPRVTPQELSQALMEHLQQMPVTVTARLATARISFQEILDLSPGDVLLLDKPIHEMVELAIEGHTAFRGRPARSEGKYAVLIRESQTARRPETPTSKTPGEPRKG
jgi:flagellar motor switch protein FliM